MHLPPLERKALFAAACTRREKTKTAAAREDLGVSWTHLEKVLAGEREGSLDLLARIAAYLDLSPEEVWGDEIAQRRGDGDGPLTRVQRHPELSPALA